MINSFERIVIEVPSLASARADYDKLLGDFSDGVLALANVAVELHQEDGIAEPRIRGLVLIDDEQTDEPEINLPGDLRGLTLSSTAQRRLEAAEIPTATGISAVDHIVLMTGDADDCIRLFGEGGLDMRLALDQLVPEWGGRMLFFRCGKLTLEIIQRLEDPPAEDFFWGITYLCPDLEFTLGKLDAAGIEHSPIREGRKPGTRVATIKSHNLGLPTLLIEPAAPTAR